MICAEKVRYRSHAKAEQARIRTVQYARTPHPFAEYEARRDIPRSTYPCRECGFWHLTHYRKASPR